jgi:hypothetical protein
VEVWIAFLLVAFFAGARVARRDGRERIVWALLGCVMVAGLLMFERFA